MLHGVRVVTLLDSLLHVSSFWEWIDASSSMPLFPAVIPPLIARHLDGKRALLLEEYLLTNDRFTVDTLRHFVMRFSTIKKELWVSSWRCLFVFNRGWRLLLLGLLLPVYELRRVESLQSSGVRIHIQLVVIEIRGFTWHTIAVITFKVVISCASQACQMILLNFPRRRGRGLVTSHSTLAPPCDFSLASIASASSSLLHHLLLIHEVDWAVSI